MKIALVLPSRARPALFGRMLGSALETATHRSDVWCFVGLNEDDPTSKDYDKGSLPSGHFKRKMFASSAKGREIWNSLAMQALEEGFDWIWIGSDDIVFDAKGWDSVLEKSCTPNPRFVWGNDGSCGDRHATHPFLNSVWLEVVGKAMPDCCQQYDGDTFITELGKETGLGVFMPEIVTRHMNHKYGLGVADDTWNRTKPLQKVDYDIYRGPAGRAEFTEALRKLRNAPRY